MLLKVDLKIGDHKSFILGESVILGEDISWDFRSFWPEAVLLLFVAPLTVISLFNSDY